MTRRVLASTFLFVALAASGVGWAPSPPETRAVDSAVTLTRPPGLSIDAALKGRSEILTRGWAEQRLPNARVRLSPAVLVGVSLLLAAASLTLARPSPAPRPTLWRRWSLALRAPPLLPLS
jgi:hypothetical protein